MHKYNLYVDDVDDVENEDATLSPIAKYCNDVNFLTIVMADNNL